MQAAVAELLDANSLSDRKLAEIHASFLALHENMAYKLTGAYAPERHRIEASRAIDPEAVAHLARIFRDDNGEREA